METKIVSRVIDFMAGGGEMGKLIREIDWSQTVLGSVEEWPQSRVGEGASFYVYFPND